MIALVVILAVVVGISLGLLGGGGSILAVPLLVYVGGLEPKEAIATSLFVVGVTSAFGVIPHARANRVRWRTGLLFGAAGMAGAYAGGRVAEFIPESVLLVAFSLMMIATAVAMIRGRRGVEPKPDHHEIPVLHVVLEGVAVGVATGLVGAGGGFLVVPALALLGGLAMPAAVGTSLVVIAMKSFAGLAGYLAAVQIDWGLALAVTVAAVIGSSIGARVSGRIPQDALRIAFGWMVIVLGVFVLVQQLPASVARSPLTWGAVGASVVVAVVVAGVRGAAGAAVRAAPRRTRSPGARVGAS